MDIYDAVPQRPAEHLMETLRLDDLQYRGLKLYQRTDLPCFSQDSVLLAAFADLKPMDRAVDIGAGTGVLATLLHVRTGAAFSCIEKEPALCALLHKSMAHNKLTIPVHALDWNMAPARLGHGVFTAALCNPPYYENNPRSQHAERATARTGDLEHDVLQEVSQCATKLLQYGGRLYLCHRAERLADVFVALRQNGLEPKRLQLVAHTVETPAYLALICAKKGGHAGLKHQPLLVLKNPDGSHHADYRRIYHMDDPQDRHHI